MARCWTGGLLTARVPLNSKTAQSSSRASPSSSSSTVAASLSTATPTVVSNISLFLTNLRLLDLDLHPSWPDISALTFSTKDAQQGQKKRIQCVEWALYQLFTLWDPSEAREKLQPFFPPLDQVQSLNLRAALLRSLEHAKKNGVLGRDAVVRKTMLDECKGERLEEVLAVFSSAVLKKLVAEQQLNEPQFPALAQTLALENRGYSGERAELITLILAHRASLGRTLEKKNAARVRYSDFSQALDMKEKALAQRRGQIKALQDEGAGGKDISDDLKLDVWRTVRNNWSGNERWMETLLYGDSNSHKDGLLSAPFDRVWRRVESGRLAELQDKSGGLLEQLDNRVKNQKERLEKWKGFRQRMFGKTDSEPAKEPDSQPRERGIDLGFRVHDNLHFGRMSPRKLARPKPSKLQDEYTELIQSLETDLAEISPEVVRVSEFFKRPPQTPRDAANGAGITSPEPEVVSELSDIEDEPLPAHRPPQRREPVKTLEPVLRRTRTFAQKHSYFDGDQPEPTQLRRSATIQARNSAVTGRRPTNPSPTRSPERSPERKPLRSPEKRPEKRTSPPLPQPQPSPTRVARSPPYSLRSPPILAPVSPDRSVSPEQPVSPTQQLADQILASVNAASPSPVKKPRHTLSLAERTRLSMARRTSQAVSQAVAADEDDEELERLPVKRNGPTISVDPPQPAEQQYQNGGTDEADVPYEDLASRTRRSMAGFEAAQKKAQLERRRSIRKSKQIQPAPAGRNFATVDEEENTTLVLAEELMSVEHVDYDSVFMSRPKIKTSPVGTPVRGLWDD
ncbi:HAUS augmin-like complex subunit 6 N-terminus-domain-containing protein [Lasiosphaeris hirsuta]|uniref:HAUS augmin-like complex subunit 6 N-terminus-domain-containing protein n=1 Tax=Lasiosphaeris hirsuta TaxID=260670 RepID=A0AA40AF56_9PEZI|nr:HAUS augmin-like complex subunit 6 N-terminus-domain-containing protein [Lasiosphaeris hirsuta]